MGKWSQRALRGGGGSRIVSLLPAPVLALTPEPGIAWTYTDTDPDHWNLESSVDGNDPWTLALQFPAGDRDETGLANSFYRIYGANADESPFTQTSNVVDLEA